MRDFKKMAIEAARIASGKKAGHIVLLDLHRLSDVADYMLVVTAESSPQIRAIRDAVEDGMAKQKLRPTHRDEGNRWVAIDYGAFMVHILSPEARELFRLEKMWENPGHVVWEKAARKKITFRKSSSKKVKA